MFPIPDRMAFSEISRSLFPTAFSTKTSKMADSLEQQIQTLQEKIQELEATPRLNWTPTFKDGNQCPGNYIGAYWNEMMSDWIITTVHLDFNGKWTRFGVTESYDVLPPQYVSEVPNGPLPFGVKP